MRGIPPKVLAGFAVTIIAIALFAGLTARLFSERTGAASALNRGFETGRRIDTLALRLAELEAAERTYVLTGDRDARAACEEAAPALNGALTMLHESLAHDPEGLRRNELLGTLVAQRLTIVGRLIAIEKAALAGPGVTALLTQGAVIDGRARGILGELRHHAQTTATAAQESWERVSVLSERGMAFGIGFLALLVLIAGRLVVRDLTARSALTEQLRGERQRLGDVLGAMPIGVVLVEAPDRKLLFANQEARRLLHLDAEAQAETPFVLGGRAIQDPDGRPLATEQLPIARAMRGEIVSAEDLIIGPGERRHEEAAAVRASAVPLREPDGRVRAVVSAFMDIRDRQRFEDFQRWVVGIVGHDLRTPLSAIDLTVSRLIEKRAQDLPEDAVRGLRRIASSSSRMKRLIDDLLDFNRARFSGGIPIEPRSAELVEIVRDQVAELETVAPGRTRVVALCERGGGGVVVGGQGGAESPRAAGVWGRWDPERIAQLVSNLVRNAIQHGDGTVDVTVEQAPTEVVLRVHNQNRGGPIPPELIPHLFDPFRRGSDSPSGGLGLGLYIACEIARAHGGEIQVRSTAEEGTTFDVRLPRMARARRGTGETRAAVEATPDRGQAPQPAAAGGDAASSEAGEQQGGVSTPEASPDH